MHIMLLCHQWTFVLYIDNVQLSTLKIYLMLPSTNSNKTPTSCANI